MTHLSTVNEFFQVSFFLFSFFLKTYPQQAFFHQQGWVSSGVSIKANNKRHTRCKKLLYWLHAKTFHNPNYNCQHSWSENLMALLPTPQDNNHDKYNLYYMVNLGFDLYQVSKTKKKRQLQSSSRNIFIFLKVIFFLQVIYRKRKNSNFLRSQARLQYFLFA